MRKNPSLFYNISRNYYVFLSYFLSLVSLNCAMLLIFFWITTCPRTRLGEKTDLQKQASYRERAAFLKAPRGKITGRKVTHEFMHLSHRYTKNNTQPVAWLTNSLLLPHSYHHFYVVAQIIMMLSLWKKMVENAILPERWIAFFSRHSSSKENEITKSLFHLGWNWDIFE